MSDLHMSVSERWLLPEGVEEILPEQAWAIEHFRRHILDLYQTWGYELVMPPLIEFQESLLIGMGADMDLASFKLTDQQTGRLLALRADITPQAARIDAHSLAESGVSRLCYAESVVHTRPKALMASRTPIQLGAEIFGEASIAGDVEIICLMLETLQAAGAKQLCLDLGHVGVYRSLAEQAGFSASVERQVFEALQRKSRRDLEALIKPLDLDAALATSLLALLDLCGDLDCLDQAAQQFPADLIVLQDAVATLKAVAEQVQLRMPAVSFYVDLAELRGYEYHTGLVFSALTPGFGRAVANGGRYDNIGEVFGRGRPATGFSADLKTLVEIKGVADSRAEAIYAPALKAGQQDYWQLIADLRGRGERVIVGFDEGLVPESCNRVLNWRDGAWQLESV